PPVSFSLAAAAGPVPVSLRDALPILASFADIHRANAQIRFVSFYAHYSAPFLVEGAAGLAMPWARSQSAMAGATLILTGCAPRRSEEHTSELQSRENLVCRLLLEEKK